jgi:hypothetical protein
MGFELLYGVGGLLLFAALIWGAMNYRERKRAQPQPGDTKTRELYQRPDE